MEASRGRTVSVGNRAVVALVVAATLAVSCVSCGGYVVWPFARFLLLPGGFCSDDDARLLRTLGREPSVATAPVGFVATDRYAFQPCEGNGDSAYYGAVGTRWIYPPTGPGTTEVSDFYRRLMLDGGWRIRDCGIRVLV